MGILNLRRVWRAFGASIVGLKAAWRSEAAFQQELLLFALLAPLGLWLGQDAIERALLLAPLFLVLVVELLNTAVEAAVDRIGSEWHELSGLAKDLGSAAVLISLILLIVIWSLILCPRWC